MSERSDSTMRDADDASHDELEEHDADVRRHADVNEADELEQAADAADHSSAASGSIPADVPEADALEQRAPVDGDDDYEPT